MKGVPSTCLAAALGAFSSQMLLPWPLQRTCSGHALDVAVQASGIMKGLVPGPGLVESLEERVGEAHGPVLKPRKTFFPRE